MTCGHEGHSPEQHIQDYRHRFFVSMALTVPLLWLWYTSAYPWVQALLATAIFFYGGWPFLRDGVQECRKHQPGMMTLIALAITVSYSYSLFVAAGLPGKSFFWELATLIDIMLAGHWIEMRAVMGTSKALDTLARLLPKTAHRKEDGDLVDVDVTTLAPGDVVVVKPGEKIPADGTVIDGSSHVNEAMLTGEARPVRKSSGAAVTGGAINGSGALTVRIDKTGEDAYLHRVMALVAHAQHHKSQTQRLADRAALWLTVVAIVAGAVTVAIWLGVGAPLSQALERMVTVMVITCPHALGLAIPLVASVSMSLAARNGLLIRNRTAFEQAHFVDTVHFDKTGTLTSGELEVSKVQTVDDSYDTNAILKLAASVESQSEHPIAQAIVHRAKTEGIDYPQPKNFQALAGKGVEASVDGLDVSILSARSAREQGLSLPEDQSSQSSAYVIVSGRLVGYIEVGDLPRAEAAETIAALKKQGKRTVALSGDRKAAVESVSMELNLDGYHAELLPHEKLEIIEDLQRSGHVIAMVGDGVNDAPALAQADLGIAIGSGTDVAVEAGDVVIVQDKLTAVAKALELGNATRRKMWQNLWWACGYNVVAIPLAAGILYPWGIVLSPAVGAVLMSLSTVVCAWNAQTLKLSTTR